MDVHPGRLLTCDLKHRPLIVPGQMAFPALSQPSGDRTRLTKRSIPHMILGNGSAPPTTSLLEDTSQVANGANSSICVASRFRVNGNAIVTGGTGALGLAACHALLEHGLSNLAILDLNASNSEHALQALRGRFQEAQIMTFEVDVTDESAVEAAVSRVHSYFGTINHLLCFSGMVGCYDAMTTPLPTWRRIIDVNTTGSFICAKAVARRMAEQGTGGSIIFIASISAHRVNYPQPQAAYNVSKAALVTLKNCLAAEWARYGIRVNSISPGYMDTILNEGEGIAAARKSWAERNPIGRLGQPRELTGVVVLLSSASSTYVNGSDFVVDGGGIVF
jgi:sorbose reductase